MNTETFTATFLKHTSAPVFNSVQANGIALIKNKNRPDMVLMLKESHGTIVTTAIEQQEKIRQLTNMVKSLQNGDAHLQKDLLK